jgi:hypothetical protein
VFAEVLAGLGMEAPDAQLRQAVEANTKAKMREVLAKTFAHNTFVRKATAGDWRNHLSEEHINRQR